MNLKISHSEKQYLIELLESDLEKSERTQNVLRKHQALELLDILTKPE